MRSQFHKTNPLILLVLGLALVLVVARSREPQLPAAATPLADAEGGGVVTSARQALMGTEFKVTVWTPTAQASLATRSLRDVFTELEALEARLSSWRTESETSRLNRAAGQGAVPIGESLHQLLSRSLYWTERTNGAFDITGGPLFELWEQARAEGALPSPQEIEARRSLTGAAQIDLHPDRAALKKPGMKLGFGGIGKGFAADQAASFLQSRGISNFLIDAGGDLLVRGRRGTPSWHVALRHPRRHEFLATLEARDGAIASSGDYERYFTVDGQRFSHLLDLRTGWPATQHSGVTVIAPSATDADALATALSVMSNREALDLVESLPGVEALLVDRANRLLPSSGLHLNGDRLTIDCPDDSDPTPH